MGLNQRTECYVLEDEIDDATNYVKHAKIDDMIDEIGYFNNAGELMDAVLDKKAIRVFLIDLNLGDGEEEAGLAVIKHMRPLYPRALIIVHTAHDDLQEACKEAGADHFFHKGHQYNETMKKIESIIGEFVNVSIVEFIGEVAQITDKWVKLECDNGKKIVDKTFPISLIGPAFDRELRLDDRVKVKAIQKNASINLTVEAITETPEPEPDDDDNGDDLLNLDIWNNSQF